MSSIETVLVWLAEQFASKAFDRLFAENSVSERRALTQALLESQRERDELRDVGRMLGVIADQRDRLFAENQRLRGIIETLRAPESRQFVPGSEVLHPQFGRGTVMRIDRNRLEIDFGSVGVKRVLDEFVSLVP